MHTHVPLRTGSLDQAQTRALTSPSNRTAGPLPGSWSPSLSQVEDAALLKRWPGCFTEPSAPRAPQTDLRAALVDDTFRAQLSALSADQGPAHLNGLRLVVNPGLRPRAFHVPLVPTTVEKNMAKLQQTLVNLLEVDHIRAAPLYLAIEGFSLALLEMIGSRITYTYPPHP